MRLSNPFRRIITAFKKPKSQPPPETPQYFIVQIFPNQFCFELNVKTCECKIVSLQRIEGNKYMLFPKDDCMYEVAINRRNAIRKFNQKLTLINKGFSKQ